MFRDSIYPEGTTINPEDLFRGVEGKRRVMYSNVLSLAT